MSYEDKWSHEISLLRLIISKTKLIKEIKWGSEVFTFNDKNVVSYGAFKNYFAVWFYNGVFLKDSKNVLVSAQEGKTKSLRQWRMRSVDEIDEITLLEYINEAIEIEKLGLKIKPEPFKAVFPCRLFADALQEDANLRAGFEKLSPGKQKEYVLYIDEAKQEVTKQNRIAKIIPMILSGSGLNDKYKRE